MHYKAVIEYVGTRFAGWQIQESGKTVQGELKDALSRLAGEGIAIVGASRTDAGVHARGQVAHFSFPQKESVPDLRKALNAILPWDIRVRIVHPVPASFNAQFDATRKLYEYVIHDGPVLPPFSHHLAAHVFSRLDEKPMKEAASHLLGTHNFNGFAAASTTVKSRVRTVLRAEVVRRGDFVKFRVAANGFLHHMVRNIVGTLIEVGEKKRPPSDIPAIIASQRRTMAGPTAPAHGLFLVKIWYR